VRRAAYSPASGCTTPAELGKVRVQQGPCDELGHPATASGRDVQQWSVVERLHQLDRLVGQQRTEQPGDEMRLEVGEVGVEVHQDVAAGHRERLPQHLALARPGAARGQDVVAVVYHGPGRGRDRRGPIHRSRVDHHDLVNQASPGGQLPNPRHDLPDGRLLVQRGQHHAHNSVGLRGDEAVDRPAGGRRGTAGEPGGRDGVHGHHANRPARLVPAGSGRLTAAPRASAPLAAEPSTTAYLIQRG